MRKTTVHWKSLLRTAALAVAVAAVPVKAADSTNMVTWSISGSTAMRSFTNSAGFTILEATEPQLTLSNGTYLAGSNGIQLAPNLFTGSAIVGSFSASASGAGVRAEWHEQGSVEGILEMVSDQIGYDGGILGTPWIDPATRNPTAGNPIRINLNNFTTATTIQGYTISNSPYNTYDTSNYNAAGTNLQGGQNRVQMAISDVRAVQGFAKSTGGSTPAPGTPAWGLAPGNTGYGQGNTALSAINLSGLGYAGARQQFVDDDALNMKTTIYDPATINNSGGSTTYAAGAWNTAGIGNLVSKTVAITATVMTANPGTGLTQLNKSDAQWLQLTGRLQNGADFNVTQRDVNSGTRNVFALNSGVDPTWAVGEDDDGNGNSTGGTLGTAAQQASIGSKIKFSGKTAGGGQLRPTVVNSRMAVGPLSMSDAIGNVKNNASNNPLRALAYSNTDSDTGANFVQPTASSITDGSYVIWQQEQYVTVRTPDSNYANDDSIKGDPDGDIAKLRNNILNSVNATFPNQASLNTPADQLLFNSFILPQMMLVAKDVDEKRDDDVSGNVVNGQTQTYWRNAFLGDPNLPAKFNTATPTSVTAGSGSKYGVVSGTTALTTGATDVPITAQNSSGIATSDAAAPKGNYLFGNFNQNGVRDFDAVKKAQAAQAALFAGGGAPAVDVNYVGAGSINNATFRVTGISTALDSMNAGVGPSKGDLIVMGDYNSDGKFDGKDLYLMARGAAISDATGTGYANGTLNATAATFGDKVRSGVLRKNAALDWMQTNATSQQRLDASPNLTNDPTGANAFNKFDVNRDGKVNRLDAAVVDYAVGKDYRNLGDQVGAVYNNLPVSLVDAELNDTGDITYLLSGGTSDFKMIRDAVGSGLLDGDANFDGVVDIQDLYILATHWQMPVDRWSLGDFDYDGHVGVDDLSLLARNWQGSSGALASAMSTMGMPLTAAVPEPGSLALLSLGAVSLMRRRRK